MEAFVYCWTNMDTGQKYVGYHKGSTDDGYVCSSKYMLAEYEKNPDVFSRQIIAEGDMDDMYALETAILKSVDAKCNEEYYNRHNNHSYLLTEETMKKMVDTRRARGSYDSEANPMFGRSHTPDARAKMSESSMGIGLGEPKTDLHKKRMSEGAQRRWDKQKPTVSIDGVEYANAAQAARNTGLTYKQVRHRMESSNYPNVKRII